MVDKNNEEIHIGDKIAPYNGIGRVLLVVSQFYVEEYEEEMLFGQQIENPMAWSPLDQTQLSEMWIIVKE